MLMSQNEVTSGKIFGIVCTHETAINVAKPRAVQSDYITRSQCCH